MGQTKHTCTNCDYEYFSVTGKQQDKCEECGNTEWRRELVAP